MELRYKKLGTEKPKDLNENFDTLYEKYKTKALEQGLTSELKFVKEHGKVLIYAAYNVDSDINTGMV